MGAKKAVQGGVPGNGARRSFRTHAAVHVGAHLRRGRLGPRAGRQDEHPGGEKPPPFPQYAGSLPISIRKSSRLRTREYERPSRVAEEPARGRTGRGGRLGSAAATTAAADAMRPAPAPPAVVAGEPGRASDRRPLGSRAAGVCAAALAAYGIAAEPWRRTAGPPTLDRQGRRNRRRRGLVFKARCCAPGPWPGPGGLRVPPAPTIPSRSRVASAERPRRSRKESSTASPSEAFAAPAARSWPSPVAVRHQCLDSCGSFSATVADRPVLDERPRESTGRRYRPARRPAHSERFCWRASSSACLADVAHSSSRAAPPEYRRRRGRRATTPSRAARGGCRNGQSGAAVRGAGIACRSPTAETSRAPSR